MSEQRFETSTEFRHLFVEELRRWQLQPGRSLDLLAERCGVSRSYLGHISRYGRIPSKPVMLLLLLNLEAQNPEKLLQAAYSPFRWPFEFGSVIRPVQDDHDSLLHIKLDLDGLASRIRGIVRSELKHRDLAELTSGGSLRLGVNVNDRWLYGEKNGKGTPKFIDAFYDLCRMLGLTLRCKVEPVAMEYRDYAKAFSEGKIDFFGPIASGPHAPQGVFTQPFIHIGLAALCRKQESNYLDPLPPPQSLTDLSSKPYVLAVVKGSASHLFANTRLSLEDSKIVLCDTLEEGIERLTMSSVRNGAHLLLCNVLNALHYQSLKPRELTCAFADSSSILKLQDTVFVVRPDMPELAPMINDALLYLVRTGSLKGRFEAALGSLPPGVAFVPKGAAA